MKRIICYSLAVRLLTGIALVAQDNSNGRRTQDLDQNDLNIKAVGGPLRPGKARPPLYVNLNPAKANRGARTAPYVPSQIRHAYGFDQLSQDGTGQTIAIVDAFGNQNILQDLAGFRVLVGITTPLVFTILGNNVGGNGNGWDLETALDVEWAHAIAPGATIILSVADSNTPEALLAAVDAAVSAGANVVSMSWGANESIARSEYDAHFSRPNVTFVAASGDSGAGVEWPAVSPFVIGVGGTTLYLDRDGDITSPEVAWSGSGGGVSQIVSRPTWQNGWHQYTGRGVPDVSYAADPRTGFLVCCSTYNAAGSWWAVGGTSAGAPQWAALIALANQSQGSSLGSATAGDDLYALVQGPVVASRTYRGLYSVNPLYLFDVVKGRNSGTQSADPPYDFVAGLGTPVAVNLVPNW